MLRQRTPRLKSFAEAAAAVDELLSTQARGESQKYGIAAAALTGEDGDESATEDGSEDEGERNIAEIAEAEEEEEVSAPVDRMLDIDFGSGTSPPRSL